MDWLKRTITQIGEQMAHLSTSQRVAIGLCAVVVAGSLMWLVQYSSEPEMVTVLAQDMTLKELDVAQEVLRGAQFEAQQRGNRIYVPRQDRDKAIMALSRAEALPADTTVGFAELMADSDPFRPSAENEWRRQVALGNELARIIAAADDIESAKVVIQEKSKRRMGTGGSVSPSASVFVRMDRGKQLSQPLVEGLCRFVSGAVPGLKPHDVTVLDGVTGQPAGIPKPEEALAVGRLEERKRNEEHLTRKILEALRSVPGVVVAVSVELDASTTRTQKTGYGKSEIKSEESKSTLTESGQEAGEPGVNPNVGVALAGGGEKSRSETEDSRSDFYPPNPTEVTEVEKAPFQITRSTASIGIPRSYLVGIHQARYGPAADAAKLDDDPNFTQMRDAQVLAIRSQVKNILQARDDGDVAVSVVYDFSESGGQLSTSPLGDATVASTSTGTLGYVRQYGMQTGLVVLALVSFLMMARMVRKSGVLTDKVEPARRSHAQEVASGEPLVVGGGPVGQAGLTDGMLVGQEVDDEVLRYTQLGEQVISMVESDPKTAAELIRRWAESSEQ